MLLRFLVLLVVRISHIIISHHISVSFVALEMSMRILISIWLVATGLTGQAQYSPMLPANYALFYDADTTSRNRLSWLISAGSMAYVGTSVGLYYSWYKNYPRSGFHIHDDLGAWRQMDKAGHVFSTYAQAELVTKGLRWAEVDDGKALTYGLLSSLLFQSTIEVMDGFSDQWGFSLSDMVANGVGGMSFYLQEKAWSEQRIRIKNSFTPVEYPANAISPSGRGPIENWLKDYNGQTYWMSLNMKSFFPESKAPEWLNVAIGYGAENMFGAHQNRYQNMTEAEISEMENLYPRYSQFYISLDADLSKIETNSSFLRTLLDILNYIKMPFSTLEINTLGEVKFHLLRF